MSDNQNSQAPTPRAPEGAPPAWIGRRATGPRVTGRRVTGPRVTGRRVTAPG